MYRGIAIKVHKNGFPYVLIVGHIPLFFRDVNKDFATKDHDIANILVIKILFFFWD